jgi:DNA-binding MarR family transcriptional regulator
MVDRLADAGLVERHADPTDRRAWRLHLTDRAHPILEELRAVGEIVMDEALAGFTPAEIEAMGALLMRLRANLSPRGEADTAPSRSAADAVATTQMMGHR